MLLSAVYLTQRLDVVNFYTSVRWTSSISQAISCIKKYGKITPKLKNHLIFIYSGRQSTKGVPVLLSRALANCMSYCLIGMHDLYAQIPDNRLSKVFRSSLGSV
jgi:hypothetical protein